VNRREKCSRIIKGFGGLSSRCVKDAIMDMLARDGLDAFTDGACEDIAQRLIDSAAFSRKLAKENRRIWRFGTGEKS
jgi:hypothetical protein